MIRHYASAQRAGPRQDERKLSTLTMADQPGSQQSTGNSTQPSTTFRNLAFVAIETAGLVVLGQGRQIGAEVLRNLGGGIGAWLVCGLLAVVGAAILWAAYVQLMARIKKPRPYEPGSKRQLVAMFAAVILAGAVGSALGAALEWRLKWTAGVFIEAKLDVWPEVQGLLGWLLGMAVVIALWAIIAQVRSERKQP
jgi:hypothetical protein